MAYSKHPGIASGELVKAQDIREMDEQIYENTLAIAELNEAIDQHDLDIAELEETKADVTDLEAEITRATGVEATKADKRVEDERYSKHEQEISFIKKVIMHQLADVVESTSEDYIKNVPAYTMAKSEYADVKKLCGKTVVHNQLIGETKDIPDNTEAYSKTVPAGAKRATVRMIRGKSLALNQKIDKSIYKGNATVSGVTFTNNGDGTWTITGTSEESGLAYYYLWSGSAFTQIIGHVYYIHAGLDNQHWTGWYSGIGENTGANYIKGEDAIITSVAETSVSCSIQFWIGGYTYNITIHPYIIDLTEIFGAGNEPTSTSDNRIIALKAYMAKNKSFHGRIIISADCDAVVSTGKNLFNKDAEGFSSGKLEYASGNIIADDRFVTTPSIAVDANTSYYITAPKLGSSYYGLYYYNSSKQRIGGFAFSGSGSIGAFTTIENTAYIRFVLGIEYVSSCLVFKGNSQSDYTLAQLNIPDRLREEHPMYSVNDVYDSLTFTKPSPTAPWKEEHHKKFIEIDLGDKSWVKASTYDGQFYVKVSDALSPVGMSEKANLICDKYENTIRGNQASETPLDKSICITTSKNIYVCDSSLIGKTAAEAKALLAGTKVIYQLETETVTDVTSYFPSDFNPLLDVESGGTVTFHQSDSEFPVPNNLVYTHEAWTEPLDSTHKYLFNDNGSPSVLSNENSVAVVGAEDTLVDMTKMFGGTDVPSTVADALAAGVPTEKTEYDAGLLKSADCDEVVSEGKNLFIPRDTFTQGGITFEKIGNEFHLKGTSNNPAYIIVNRESATAGRIYIPHGTYTISANAPTGVVCRWYHDGSGSNIAINGTNSYTFTIDETNDHGYWGIYVTSGQYVDFDLHLMVEKSSSATPYSPYFTDSMNIPDRLREEHPLRSANEAYDEYNIERKFTKVNVGDVDMGTLRWSYAENDSEMRTTGALTGAKTVDSVADVPNAICSLFMVHAYSGLKNTPENFTIIYSDSSYHGQIWIRTDKWTSATEFKEAMSGVHLYYELAEPIYYYDPTSPELAVNGGTVVPDDTHIVDPESYFPNDTSLKVEDGGTLTFHQTDSKLAISNTEDFYYILDQEVSA